MLQKYIKLVFVFQVNIILKKTFFPLSFYINWFILHGAGFTVHNNSTLRSFIPHGKEKG